jgi:hypothetical protein
MAVGYSLFHLVQNQSILYPLTCRLQANLASSYPSHESHVDFQMDHCSMVQLAEHVNHAQGGVTATSESSLNTQAL